MKVTLRVRSSGLFYLVFIMVATRMRVPSMLHDSSTGHKKVRIWTSLGGARRVRKSFDGWRSAVVFRSLRLAPLCRSCPLRWPRPMPPLL